MGQRTFSVFGDSISTFEGITNPANRIYYQGDLRTSTGVLAPGDTWWSKVIEHFGGRLLANASFSGSLAEGAGFPAGRSPERIAQIAGPACTGEAGASPDDILVFIGINDFGWAGARAQAAARSEAMPRCPEALAVPEGEAGPADDGALGRFADAYSEMLARMRAAYPAARVWCLTLLPGRERGASHPQFAYRLRGIDLDDYNDVIRLAAAANGCKVADIRAAGYDYEAADGTHPTARGMEQLAALAVAAMDAADQARPGDAGTAPASFDAAGVRDTGGTLAPEAFAALPEGLFSPAARSGRPCDEATCFGCAHARGTGNSWSCVCELP